MRTMARCWPIVERLFRTVGVITRTELEQYAANEYRRWFFLIRTLFAAEPPKSFEITVT